MFGSKSCDDSDILSKLKEVELFKIYSKNNEIMNKIEQLCTKKCFSRGAVLIKEGEQGDELFILLNGEVEIVKQTLQKEKFTVTTLSSDKKGIYFGELALIDNDRRSASVLAKTDCEFLVIGRDRFIKFGNENPNIGLNITREIAKQLSGSLRKTNSDVITLFSALVDEVADEE